MKRSIMMHDATVPSFHRDRIVEISVQSDLPTREDLLTAEAVQLNIESLDKYRRAALTTHALFDAVNSPTPPLLIRINTCLGATTRDAMQRFERLVGRGSEAHLTQVWFVGTEDGLRGLVKDLQALRFGDGVSFAPARGAA